MRGHLEEERPPEPSRVVAPLTPDAVMARPRKRPDYSHMPKGARIWAPLIGWVIFELWAVFHDVEYTLSRTVWWLLGPELRPRWWLVGMPLAALLLWSVPHFLTAGRVGPVHLLWALGLSVVVACVGVIATA